MGIKAIIRSYYLPVIDNRHHRYLSWEHCYGYFRGVSSNKISQDLNQAALQLGFYLASWGMYRGSSFLLQYTYTVHIECIAVLAEEKFKPLWEHEFGAGKYDDTQLMKLIVEVINEIKTVYKTAYKPFVLHEGSQQPTDTLISKILLGTFGCLPACDRFFIDGFKECGNKFSNLNLQFIQLISDFCKSNIDELIEVQNEIKDSTGFHYPMMKLVDMYYWQIGENIDKNRNNVQVAKRGQTAIG